MHIYPSRSASVRDESQGNSAKTKKKKKRERAESLASVAFLFLVTFSVSLWIRFVVVDCTYTKSRV